MGTDSVRKPIRLATCRECGSTIRLACPRCSHVTDNPDLKGDDFLCGGCFCWNRIPIDERRTATVDVETGGKYDAGKAPLGLLPGDALARVAAAFGYGARKYSAWNWRKVKPGSRYLDAALRHLTAYASGEDNDSESGLPHTDHAAACVLIMISLGDCRHGGAGSE